MAPRAPRILYGIGTPLGTIEPLKSAEKGSIFISTDQTNAAVWVKIAANSATADWALGSGIKTWLSKEFNIDNGAATADDDILYCPRAITIITATCFYTEATDSTGAADANVKIGTTAAGTEIVGATALSAAKAIGGTQTLTIVSGDVAAAGFANIRHTGIAATEAGKYKVVLTYLEY
jgi:hypothetical protein